MASLAGVSVSSARKSWCRGALGALNEDCRGWASHTHTIGAAEAAGLENHITERDLSADFGVVYPG